jgi:hypothetical protein
MIYIKFSTPGSLFGCILSWYQRLTGCKFWKFSHVALVNHEGGVYSYCENGVTLGLPQSEPEVYNMIGLMQDLPPDYHERAVAFFRWYGHFSLLQLRKANCVSFVRHVSGLSFVSVLPGDLYGELSQRAIDTVG